MCKELLFGYVARILLTGGVCSYSPIQNFLFCWDLGAMAKKLTWNGDNTVLLFPTNNTLTRGKVILRIITLLDKNSKKWYSLYMRVSLVQGASLWWAMNLMKSSGPFISYSWLVLINLDWTQAVVDVVRLSNVLGGPSLNDAIDYEFKATTSRTRAYRGGTQQIVFMRLKKNKNNRENERAKSWSTNIYQWIRGNFE